jgi:N-acetylneuraminate synthase
MKKIKKTKTFFIAEIGANHNGNINLAKETILLAKKSGCDAVKFQSWNENLWNQKVFEKNKKLLDDAIKWKLDFKKLKILRNFSKKNKIIFGTTVFDKKQLLEALNIDCDFIKIASMDINNIQLLNDVSKIKKPVIVSTGTATEDEIIDASKIFKKKNKKNVTFLHCITIYPPNDTKIINLNNIIRIKKITGFDAGYSDHTIWPETCIAASIIGAKVIEKHFTKNKKLKGWDHLISADPNEMKNIISTSRKSCELLGSDIRKVSKTEKKFSKIMRRSFYLNRNVNRGDKIKLSDLILQRPESSITANQLSVLLGKKYKNDLKKGSLLTKKNISYKLG